MDLGALSDSYCWLLPTARFSFDKSVLSIEWNHRQINVSGLPADVVSWLLSLDGNLLWQEAAQGPLGAALLPILAENDLLVALSQPLSLIELQSPELTRQLSYFAHLTTRFPDMLLNRLRGARILIGGCGGVGSAVAYSLAGSGVRSLTLYDNDTFELTNLNRQFAYKRADVGHPKAHLLSKYLLDRFDDIQIEANHGDLDFVYPNVDFEDFDLIIFAAEYTFHLRDPEILAAATLLAAGYFGPVAVVGPLVGPSFGSCWRCAADVFRTLDPDPRIIQEFEPAVTWNSSGATINQLVAALTVEYVYRALMPGIQAGFTGHEQLRFDMRNLTIRKYPVGMPRCRSPQKCVLG